MPGRARPHKEQLQYSYLPVGQGVKTFVSWSESQQFVPQLKQFFIFILILYVECNISTPETKYFIERHETFPNQNQNIS